MPIDPTMATLDLILERRLCSSIDASSGDLWTLPSTGLPDVVLRNHVNDEILRTSLALLGSRIFLQVMTSAIAQIFASYPGNVRAVIERQMTKITVLNRISSRLPIYAHKVSPCATASGIKFPPRVQLLHAAVMALSEHHGGDCTAEWLKTLTGNLIPVIMDTVADWEDSCSQSGQPNSHGRVGSAMADTAHSKSDLVTTDDQLEGRSRTKSFDSDNGPDDLDLAEWLESHLLELGPLDDEV